MVHKDICRVEGAVPAAKGIPSASQSTVSAQPINLAFPYQSMIRLTSEYVAASSGLSAASPAS